MWEGAFNPERQPVTQALLHKSVLPAWGQGFEKLSAVMAVRAALLARTRRQTVCFLVPRPLDGTAQYLTAALLVGSFAHEHGGELLPAGERMALLKGDVLLVTPAVHPARATLLSLPLGHHESLGDVWNVEPLSRYIAGRTGKPRVFVANPGWVDRATLSKRFSAAVIDASHPRTLGHLTSLLNGPLAEVPLRVVIAPVIERSVLADCGYPEKASVWLWDAQAVVDAEAVMGNSLASLPEMPERTLWLCDEDAEANEALSKVYSTLATMMRHASGQPLPGGQQAWSIYHRLRQLTVPLVELEEASGSDWAGNLKRRLDALHEVSAPGNPAWEGHWPALRDALHGAYDALMKRQEPAKFWVLASRVEEWLADPSGDVLRVVVGSVPEVPILTRMLQDTVDGVAQARLEGRIEVVHAASEVRLVADRQDAHTILPGARMPRARYLDLYPSVDVEVVVYPFEADIDLSVQSSLYQFAYGLQRDRDRLAMLAPMGLEPRQPRPPCRRTEAPAIHTLKGNGMPIRLAATAAVDGVLDIDRLAGSDGAGVMDYEPTATAATGAPFFNGEVVEVAFAQGSVVRYPPSHRLDVFFPATDELRRVCAANLQRGWQVVSFVDGRYDDLFHRLTEAIHHRLPARARIALELWRQAKRTLLEKVGDHAELFSRLASDGLRSDYSTVRTWFQKDDEVLAPQQFEEFEILARTTGCYHDDKLLRAAFRFIQEERGRNRAAGRKLRELLRAIIRGDGYEEALESARALDTAIGDVLSAVELLQVRAVRNELTSAAAAASQ